jgi:hypothetical protein
VFGVQGKRFRNLGERDQGSENFWIAVEDLESEGQTRVQEQGSRSKVLVITI